MWVPKFKYLDSIITEDRKSKEDTIKRIKEAKVLFNNKMQLLCSNDLSLEMKKRKNSFNHADHSFTI